MISKTELILLIFVGVFVKGNMGQVPIGQCTKIDACSCVYDQGTIVNLRALESTNGQPRFSNVKDSTNDLYSWNPCSQFSYTANNSECINVAVCMVRDGLPYTLYYDLGSQDSAAFNVDQTGALKLTYTADKGEFKRITEITLKCVIGSVLDYIVADGEQEQNNDTITYKLTLTSEKACAKAPKVNPSNEISSGLSGGTVFIIALFSIIGAYLVFGVMFQAFIKKESGKKLCPNHEFWFNLPSLISGGCKKVAPLQSSEKGAKYNSI